jgi:hypothetical protein
VKEPTYKKEQWHVKDKENIARDLLESTCPSTTNVIPIPLAVSTQGIRVCSAGLAKVKSFTDSPLPINFSD